MVVMEGHIQIKRRRSKESPDVGYAWVVAIAACLINFISAGLGRMSGILYVSLIDNFQVTRKEATVPFSLRGSMRNLLGPVVGILGQQYGVRTVTLTGGVIGGLSAAACFFSPNMLWITILFGALGGIATSLSTTLPQVVIGQYFVKHRTTAAGMAFSGGCVGSFIFPVLLEYLLQTYGVQGTFLIMGGILMHIIPAAIILRRPAWLEVRKTQVQTTNTSELQDSAKITYINEGYQQTPDDHADNKSKDDHINNGSKDYQVDNRSKDDPVDNGSKDAKYESTKVIENVDDNTAAANCELVINGCLLNEKELGNTSSEVLKNFRNEKCFSHTDCNKVISSLYITKDQIAQGVDNFIEDKNADSTKLAVSRQDYQNSTDVNLKHVCASEIPQCESISDANDMVLANLKTSKTDRSSDSGGGFINHIKALINLRNNPLYLLVCICRASHFLTFAPVVTTIVDYGMDKGLLEEDGKYTIAALSLGDLIGRLCFGWVSDKGYISLPKYMLVVMVLQGATTISLPFLMGKPAILTMIAIFGMLQGSCFVRHPVLVSKYTGKNEQALAIGSINFLSGILGFALPHFIGYFRDNLGSYDYIFYITGTIGSSVGSLWILEPYLIKYSKKETSS